MHFHLVGRDLALAEDRHRAVEQRVGKVGDADQPGEPEPLRLAEAFHVVLELRLGSADGQWISSEIDMVEPQRVEALPEARQEVLRREIHSATLVVTNTSAARKAALPERLADIRLGARRSAPYRYGDSRSPAP